MTWIQLKHTANFFLEDAWKIKDSIIEATWETLYMLILTCVIAGLLGLIFGVALTVTKKGGILEHLPTYRLLDHSVNVFRSLPFIILMALLVPVTRFIVGKTIGATAATVPLIVATIPYYARQIQIALLEVDPGKIEAATAMGLSRLDIIKDIYLIEGLPAILRVSASTIINVIGLTTMAGVVGGGGLGTIAIAKGYHRNRFDVILVATLLILLLVWMSEGIFKYWTNKVNHTKTSFVSEK